MKNMPIHSICSHTLGGETTRLHVQSITMNNFKKNVKIGKF